MHDTVQMADVVADAAGRNGIDLVHDPLDPDGGIEDVSHSSGENALLMVPTRVPSYVSSGSSGI